MANTVLMSKLLLLALAFAGCQAACSTAYSDLDADHSQCKDDVGKEIVVSEKLQQQLVDKHNEYRSMVKDASDMLQVKWDSDLASTASKWAQQCDGGSEPNGNRRAEPHLPGVLIGQNVGVGNAGPMEALEGWYKEKENFIYWDWQGTNKNVDHYTQIITAKTGLIGCGEADCSGKRYQVCNYAVAGEIIRPYTEGAKSCSKCQTCDSAKKLCVCPNTVCYNGGTLDVSDCSCKCDAGFGGDLCGTKVCGKDEFVCNMYLTPGGEDPCVDPKVKKDICPNLCGWC